VRAVIVSEPGDPGVLRVAEVPDPEVAPGEVLINVAAAGVNRADLLQRQGQYPPPPGASPYLGLECAGHIRAIGEGVVGWTVGDAVCALLTGGGYAECVAVPASQVMPVPDGLSLDEAAALPEAACTVWSNLAMTAHVAAGESVLIHGGASGIGTMAIQVVRLLEANAWVTVGSDDKAERCRALGADHAINYRSEDFVDAVLTATDGRGVDVVLDIIGAKYLESNLRVLAREGRLVVIGLQGGAKAELDLGRMLSKRLSVFGTTLRSRSTGHKAAIVAEVVRNMWPAVSSGAIRPVVDRVVPLRDAAEAHRALERGETVGKVVLQITDGAGQT
jgi:putative PIG3 family NAD(P)H quinone oxidoreductase